MHAHASAPSDHTHEPYARFGTIRPYAHPYARFGAFLSVPDRWNRDSAELCQERSRNVPEGLGPGRSAPARLGPDRTPRYHPAICTGMCTSLRSLPVGSRPFGAEFGRFRPIRKFSEFSVGYTILYNYSSTQQTPWTRPI